MRDFTEKIQGNTPGNYETSNTNLDLGAGAGAMLLGATTATAR